MANRPRCSPRGIELCDSNALDLCSCFCHITEHEENARKTQNQSARTKDNHSATMCQSIAQRRLFRSKNWDVTRRSREVGVKPPESQKKHQKIGFCNLPQKDHRFLNNLIVFRDGRASTSVTKNWEDEGSERKHNIIFACKHNTCEHCRRKDVWRKRRVLTHFGAWSIVEIKLCHELLLLALFDWTNG